MLTGEMPLARAAFVNPGIKKAADGITEPEGETLTVGAVAVFPDEAW